MSALHRWVQSNEAVSPPAQCTKAAIEAACAAGDIEGIDGLGGDARARDEQ
eukprot:CAMPEP_0117685208 /NCGR_PEP_ID=MMETSP0804-20121206/21597_1 /TAXON_ID=1074897 /ORGANISM="Tetraselmis astigmatica, Strain CCMP880" /LENGTH=50 /DNA_ID=CAMNT_0005496425 /DNA_START=99 /DNA_END=251 /DNA_ORIENTATION=+